MPSDYVNDLTAEITQKMQELRGLSDEELMALHLKSYEAPRQAALMAAALNESERRYVSSGWIWKRLSGSGRYRYERWKQHFEQTGDLADEYITDVLDRADLLRSPDDDG